MNLYLNKFADRLRAYRFLLAVAWRKGRAVILRVMVVTLVVAGVSGASAFMHLGVLINPNSVALFWVILIGLVEATSKFRYELRYRRQLRNFTED